MGRSVSCALTVSFARDPSLLKGLPGSAGKSIIQAVPFQATVYNVMVACPSDVTTGLSIASEAIARWNVIHSREKRVVLLPLSWRTHSSPEMGERPQGILNKQLVEKSDLLIAIFWTRLGTPTGEAESGTVEEIREHIKAGKPIMIYFCEKDASPRTLDLEQFAKLNAVRAEFQTQGLIDTYTKDDELRDKIERHLNDKVRDHPYFKRADLEPEGPRLQLSGALTLSEEAKALLDEAVKSDGVIVILDTVAGAMFQAGKTSFHAQEPRDRAKYDGAIDALVNSGFIKREGSNRNVFRVTDAGYKFTDAGSQVQKNKDQTGGATVSAKGDVVREWQQLLGISKSDPRAAIKKSWELLADDIFRAAKVSGENVHPDSEEVTTSLKRLGGSVQFSESLISLIRELHEIARKVFNQSPFAYDPSALDAERFVLLSKAVITDLRS